MRNLLPTILLSTHVSLVALLLHCNYVCCFQTKISRSFGTNAKSRRYTSLQAAGDLPTALEWFSEEKQFNLEWMNIIEAEAEGKEERETECTTNLIESASSTRIPLYPLEACYLPLGTNAILSENEYSFIRNVEPRNIKMAIDLKQQTKVLGFKIHDIDNSNNNDADILRGDGMARFCAVLKAYDTGRIATIGTIMKVVDFDEQYMYDGKTLARVILKCQPEQTVQITNIVNPSAWSSQKRLLRSDEYLIADVKPFHIHMDLSSSNDNGSFSISESIIHDYQMIKDLYETCEQISYGYPQFAKDALSKLPQMNPITDEQSFWTACNVYQKLCYTVKEAHRVNLQSEVNEITISAAMEKGGPLNLPVHREDLPVRVRVQLDQLENDTASYFLREIGMDPCLQFQHLLATKSLSEKMILFKQMINNEVKRLKQELCM